MSLKMKLTSTIMAFILLASMLIVGVFAVKQTEFSVGGNIVFNASGIDATISAGELSSAGSWNTGDGTGKMQRIDIDTTKSASELAEEYESWSGLDLAFNEAGDDVTITFTITNNSTNADDSLVAYVSVDNGTASNAVATVSNAGAIIAPDTTSETENVEEFVITFKVLDKEVNASLSGFKIDFDIRYATVEADSATETTLSYEGITYIVGENNSVAISSYIGSPTELTIPAYIRNGEILYEVIGIGTGAMPPDGLRSCSSLIKINLPSTLISIGNSALLSTGLTSIVLPDSVTTIGPMAFQGCTNLNSVVVGKGVVSITPGLFSGCSNLKSISVIDENRVFQMINNALIDNSTNTLIYGFANTIIPENVTIIGMGAFQDRTGLTNIKIPESVININGMAFMGCTDLIKVTIDSQDVVTALTSATACGYLINCATTINVRADLSPSDYIAGLTSGGITTINGVTYNVYTK